MKNLTNKMDVFTLKARNKNILIINVNIQVKHSDRIADYFLIFYNF